MATTILQARKSKSINCLPWYPEFVKTPFEKLDAGISVSERRLHTVVDMFEKLLGNSRVQSRVPLYSSEDDPHVSHLGVGRQRL